MMRIGLGAKAFVVGGLRDARRDVRRCGETFLLSEDLVEADRKFRSRLMLVKHDIFENMACSHKEYVYLVCRSGSIVIK